MEIFVAKWLPCLHFWRSGRSGAAAVALLLQISILLWPIASFWAVSGVVRAMESEQWHPLVRRDF